MSGIASPSSAAEALEMLRSAMGYLATSDATGMAAETQAQCLQALEQINLIGTAARAVILAGFTSGQGYTADADYRRDRHGQRPGVRQFAGSGMISFRWAGQALRVWSWIPGQIWSQWRRIPRLGPAGLPAGAHPAWSSRFGSPAPPPPAPPRRAKIPSPSITPEMSAIV